MRHSRIALVSAMAALCSALAPPQTAVRAHAMVDVQDDAARYAEYLRAYRDGRIDEAATGVSELWCVRRPDAAMFAALDAAQASAAVALQCDLAWHALVTGQYEDSEQPLKIAERLLDLRVMKDDPGPRVRAVRRGWYLFTAWTYALFAKHDLLDAQLARALRLFPEDPDFLIARGSFRERRADRVRSPASWSATGSSRRCGMRRPRPKRRTASVARSPSAWALRSPWDRRR